MTRTAGGKKLDEGKFWCSHRLVKEARRTIDKHSALADKWLEALFETVKIFRGIELPEGFRHQLDDLVISIGRSYIEDGPDTKALIADVEAYAPAIMRYLQPDDAMLRWIDRLLLPAAAVYALSRLAERTQGLEPEIRKLLTKARQVEKTDPERAKIIRAEADHLCKGFPRGFVPTARKIGRPNLNPWRAKLEELLSEDGMPTTQMAKAFRQDPASLRRRRKLSRSKIAKALRPAVARRIADPKR